jgi:hypothetical protein
MRATAMALALAVTTASHAAAAPDLRRSRAAGRLTTYADDRQPALFYYGPGEMAIATDSSGRPDLHFLEARYTGTAATGDQGRAMFHSLLSLRVIQTGVSPQELAAARQVAGLGPTVELRPLPIQRLEAALVYAPLKAEMPTSAAAAEAEAGSALPAGHFEAGEEGSTAYWTERTYVLALSPEDAQLFGDALRRGRLVLSLAYAFFALGPAGPGPAQVDVRGPSAMRDAFQQLLGEGSREKAEGEATPLAALVRAGATSISVDAQRWPDLFHRIDINESLPPGYAALEIYCYDFNNALRPDLYEKQVEIEATGVAGPKVTLAMTFASARPELYAHSLRFPVAVRFDRAYRYRVTEIRPDGTGYVQPWTTITSWSRILDVTSATTEPTVRPSSEDKP